MLEQLARKAADGETEHRLRPRVLRGGIGPGPAENSCITVDEGTRYPLAHGCGRQTAAGLSGPGGYPQLFQNTARALYAPHGYGRSAVSKHCGISAARARPLTRASLSRRWGHGLPGARGRRPGDGRRQHCLPAGHFFRSERLPGLVALLRNATEGLSAHMAQKNTSF